MSGFPGSNALYPSLLSSPHQCIIPIILNCESEAIAVRSLSSLMRISGALCVCSAVIAFGAVQDTYSYRFKVEKDGELVTWKGTYYYNPIYDCKKATFEFNGTQIEACKKPEYNRGSLFGGAACEFAFILVFSITVVTEPGNLDSKDIA